MLLATTVRWPSAGRLAGAFSEAGMTVEGLLPSDHPAQHSRYFKRIHLYRPLSGAAAFADAIAHFQPDIVLPLDDRATSLMLQAYARASDEVAKLIEHSLGDLARYPELMSRGGFIAAAAEADIRTPLTYAIHDEDELEAALAKTGFPAVIKADGTWGGSGVIVAHDRESARRAYRKLSDPPSLLRSIARAIRRSDLHHLQDGLKPNGSSVSVQQFVSGTPATTSLSCWKGKLLAANHLETVASQERNGPASVLRRIESKEMDDAASRLVLRFGLSGIHGLDYIRDHDGRAYLLEINPRSPQSSYLSFGPRHDPVSSLAGAATGRNRTARPRAAGDVIALFPQEWMRDPASPYLKEAFHDVPWDDPALVRAWMNSPEARPALARWRVFMADNGREPVSQQA
ncbi:MAG TPA: ATP-grasp domain-containing protein [Rhizomicrobium sp.]|nr:ATP-grasp domain-containing protein [Rhizomicrobium sp.]